MSDQYLGVDPEAPARPQASRTEVELAALEVRRQELLARKAAEDAIKNGASHQHRAAAIALHTRLCPSDHASLACPWHLDPHANDPDAADWTEEQHRRWLAIVVLGVQELQANGWTIVPPTE